MARRHARRGGTEHLREDTPEGVTLTVRVPLPAGFDPGDEAALAAMVKAHAERMFAADLDAQGERLIMGYRRS